MNRKLPYEKRIAEKMQNLLLPGKEMMWEQMKAKLDREMPLSEKGEKGGGGKWWWLGSIVIILSAGIWMITGTTTGDDQTMVAGDVGDIEPILGEPANAIDYRSQLTVNSADKNVVNATPGDVLKNAAQFDKKEETAGSVINSDKTVQHTHSKKSADLNKNDNLVAAASQQYTLKDKGEMNADSKQYRASGRTVQLNTLPAIESNPQKITAVVDHHAEAGNRSVAVINNYKTNIAEGLSPATGYRSVNTKNSVYSSRKNIIQSAHSNEAGILTVPVYVSTLPDVSAERKDLLRAMKRRERKEEKELAKSYRTYHSFWGETTDRWFAAGIAPYQNIAIASQQTYNYNSAAGKNIITDYIPSPYLQLHVTNRIYLLSEFQFHTPQATPSLLLSHKELTVPSGNAGYTENIYLRKLYYFNMPVSFYYSPVRNFYIGSGLQFSSFNSGLADIEQRSAGNILLRSETIKLKDDSLSSKINGSEWRYLFDANYYYNRFMVGFRYNQALNNFVDLRINNILPPTQARNQAFQFYIRYNLVVSDRKK